MPPRFIPTPSPRCPRCSKAVYSAEQIIGPNGGAWHKSCFTCRECNRSLDSATLAEHEGEAYCKPCHKKMWGPTGYGYAGGLLSREGPESQFKQSIGRPVNSAGNNDSSSSSFNNLNQAVFNNIGRNSPVERHQSTLARHSTGDSTASANSRTDTHHGSVHYNGSQSGYLSTESDSSSAFGSTKATTSSPAPSLSSMSSSSNTATKSLYLNQSIRSNSAASSLHQDTESEYAKHRQALSFQTGTPPTSSGSTSSSVAPPALPRRNPEPARFTPSSQHGSEKGDDSDFEYAPIRIVARKDNSSQGFIPPVNSVTPTPEQPHAPAPAHVPASTAVSAQAVEEHEWDTEPIHIQTEENKPKHQPIYLSQYLKQQRQKEQEQEQGQEQEHEQERQQSVSHISSNFNRPSSSTDINSTTTSMGSTPLNATPKTSYYRSGNIMTPKKATYSFGGGGDICPRCKKTVYHAESALAPGGAKYHKLCLRCVECSKSLDSTNMTDRQGTPYCKTCYGKAFGAKGFGYGSGASMLHTEL
ncbi:hypothetical protein BG011_006687 [Mortierella polycephala]|uniref:LIM zinc-binding domain-containing protein n=1 Tax=Mortierella polycephala TaxID=41804 RepID=A0A9P6PUC4_9FUNG|nr:hypothetical protein BG011_006687 [Mortierella polycephala]